MSVLPDRKKTVAAHGGKEVMAGKVVGVIDKLPPMPDNIVALRQAAANPNSNFGLLVPLLKKDPGLCADLLRFANSACYGVRHHVDTVEEAVRYFGMRNLANYVAAAFSERVVRESFGHLVHLNEYCQHSRTVSVACMVLAETAGLSRHDQDVYSVAGLLHDIGRLVLMMASDQTQGSLMDSSWEEMMSIVDDERALMGLDHCDVGARICNKWKFSSELQEGIRMHHHPLVDGKPLQMSSYILLAHLVAFEEIPLEIATTAFPEDALAALHLTPQLIEKARNACIAV